MRRQNLRNHDVEGGFTPHLRGGDIVLLAQLQGHAADDAGDLRRRDEHHGHDDVQGRGSKLHDDDDVEHDRRKRENDVGDPVDHLVDPAAIVSGEEAEHAAKRIGDEDRDWCHGQHGA
jgi:hypothetical protein